MMWYFVLQCMYLMLPAYFANMMPVLVKKINFLDKPISKKYLGNHKTWRGIVFGTLAGMLVAYIQKMLYAYPFFAGLSFVDYSNWLIFGFLLGFGALFGDAVKSFFKRKAGVKPGGRFIPADQLDYSLGSILFVSFVFRLTWQMIVVVLVVNFILHIIANHLGYYLGLSKVKW